MSPSQAHDLLRRDPEFARYREALEDFVSGRERDETILRQAASELCRLSRAQGIRPETLLAMLRAGDHRLPVLDKSLGVIEALELRARRTTRALDILLDCYFSDDLGRPDPTTHLDPR